MAIHFSGPPLYFDEVQIGYMSFSACIGSFVGYVFYTVVSDRLVRYVAFRNSGVYEPEIPINIGHSADDLWNSRFVRI